jgi:hypothetical protein
MLKPNRQIFLLGIALAALGCLLAWRGFTTMPGEPALQIPNREDWSATEATLIGVVFIVVGVYAAAFLSKRRK